MPLMFKPKKIEFTVPLKIKQNISKQVEDATIYKLIFDYNNMISDENLSDFNYSKNKIQEVYNIDETTLMKYYMEYYIDSESLNNKLEILNNKDNIKNSEYSNNISTLIESYFNYYKLKEDVYILPDESKSTDSLRYVIVTNDNDLFSVNRDKHYSKEIIDKFNLKKYLKEDGTILKNIFKKDKLEDVKYIGFFDIFRKKSIVFKYKELSKNNNKLNKGKQCGLGQNKQSVILIVKYLVKKMNLITNNNEVNINNFKEAKKKGKSNQLSLTEYKDLSSKKYCFLIYFMLKYLNDYSEKRYFFNLLETFIYKVHDF